MAAVLHDFVFKYIVIGDVGVGKSCFLFQFTDGHFLEESAQTVCVEFNSKITQVNDKRFKLQIWDTSGQERFKDIAKTYYRGAACIFLMYDVTRRSTFENIKMWLADARANATPGTVFVLLANKWEPGLLSEVPTEEAAAFAESEGLMYFEVSAKSGHNVNTSIEEATKRVYENALAEGEDMTMAGGIKSTAGGNESMVVSSDSLLNNPYGSHGHTNINSLERAYARLSLYSMLCVIAPNHRSGWLVRAVLLPWQVIGRLIVVNFYMAVQMALVLPCMFMVLVQRPREIKAKSATDTSLPEPIAPITLPLFITKSLISLLFLLAYPLVAVYYLVPIYIFRQDNKLLPKFLVTVLTAIPVLVLVILLLFGIARRLQKRKMLQISRSDEIKLEKHVVKYRWTNLGNVLVVAFLILEWLQVVGLPLQPMNDGSKFFSSFYFTFPSHAGTRTFFWLSVVCVFILLAAFNVQMLADLRNYLLLTKQGKIEEAHNYYYFSLFGSVIYGHGKPDNIGDKTRYVVMIISDGLFFLILAQLFSILTCEYGTQSSEMTAHLLQNPDVVCWTPAHYREAFFTFFCLGYFTLFSGLVSPLFVESSGVSKDIHFHGIYTTAVHVIKLLILYFSLIFGPYYYLSTALPAPPTLVHPISGILLFLVTIIYMLRTSTRMRQPSASAAANIARAFTWASLFVAGTVAYSVSQLHLEKDSGPVSGLIAGIVVAFVLAVGWYVVYRRRGPQYEFSKMANSQVLIEEGSEMDSVGPM